MPKLLFLNQIVSTKLKRFIQFCLAYENEQNQMTSYDPFQSVTYYTVQGPERTRPLRTDRARRETSFWRTVTTSTGTTQVRVRAFVLDVV